MAPAWALEFSSATSKACSKACSKVGGVGVGWGGLGGDGRKAGHQGPGAKRETRTNRGALPLASVDVPALAQKGSSPSWPAGSDRPRGREFVDFLSLPQTLCVCHLLSSVDASVVMQTEMLQSQARLDNQTFYTVLLRTHPRVQSNYGLVHSTQYRKHPAVCVATEMRSLKALI